ncbi:hypothetical protein HBI26_202890 [Parastagonospora nodorum]|nr:hypothetical protein HBI10_141450 [Parastagonospora nodorum]KAH4020995.1 hypothetical protein HBI13_109750 [Parastagonospora nodorum]KAH4107757.1 hypothetical protein HBH46_052600 [Parastagonospora nodorum]KAH4119853.1 hypothetical protein HBH47_120920 [Parastagonospora nodorum]KAH4898921.1 hypothetical protein HBH74_187130 [Parastagonospora nodorum]
MFRNLYANGYTRWAALQRLLVLPLLPYVVEDVEATADMIHRSSTSQSLDTNHALVEMQPRTIFPLYFDSSMISPEAISIT